MSLTIRPFDASERDYATIVMIRNTIYPEHQLTVGEVQHGDAHREEHILLQRWIGELDGQPVGSASYSHMSWNYHPRKFSVRVTVLPEHEKHGYGSALYHNLLLSLAEHDPILLRTGVREDHVRGVRFAEKCGFHEEMREWESYLEVAGFDPSRFAAAAERATANGIVIRSLGELSADPEHARKLYDLQNELMQDVPMAEPFTPQTFEAWQAERMSDPNYLPEGYFIALAGDEYVGVSALWRRQTGNYLSTGLTGVKREWRRKGIALALKLRAIDFARRQGAERITTGNASTNAGMLSINQELGFVRHPAWIQMVRHLKEKT